MDLQTSAPTPRRPTTSRRKRYAASLSAQLGAIRPAPDRVRLWRAGANPWDGGIINLTPEAVARVMSEYERRGNPLSMDIEHAITLAERRAAAEGKQHVEDPPLPSAGYCVLEAVESPDGPELWFLPRWSDCGRDAPVPGEVCCARHQIESGQRCQFSPDWDADASTGEPIRVNRISLVLDGATHNIGLLASRAARRTASMAMDEDPIARCKAAYAYHTAMAGQGGDDAKAHEDMAGKIAGHAAALGIDLKGEHKEPDGDEAQPAEAAEPIPAPDGGGEHLEERAEPQMSASAPVQAAAARPVAPKPPARTAASRQVVDPARIVATVEKSIMTKIDERQQLDAIINANKDRIPEAHVQMLASRGSLSFAREYIAGLPARPAPAGSDGAAPIPNGKRPWMQAPAPEHRFLASRVDAALGMTPETAAAFDKEVGEDGSYEVSIVKLVKQKREERLAASRRVA